MLFKKRLFIAAVAVTGLNVNRGRALAFADPAQFFAHPEQPAFAALNASADGVYFTGGPRFARQTCQACHIDTPQTVQLRLSASPPSLFTDGYEPHQTYELEVDLLGEHEGLSYSTPTCTEAPGPGQSYDYVQCNNNSFAFEAAVNPPLATYQPFCTVPLDSNGNCPPPNPMADETFVAPDGTAVFGNRRHDPQHPEVVLNNGPTSWHLFWTAPPAGSGPVTFYVAAVDGNGGSGTAQNDQDPFGDDTVQAAVSLPELTGLRPGDVSAGCSVHRAEGAQVERRGSPLALLLYALLFFRFRLRNSTATRAGKAARP